MSFTDDELARYARHIVLREFGAAGQARLKTATVAVVGAGGIGSPAIQYLAGAGVGVWVSSTALIGAALDNLADASVYGVSLYAVGRAATIKVRAARLSGWLLIGLAVLLFVEVLRRFFGGEEPIGPAMMRDSGSTISVPPQQSGLRRNFSASGLGLSISIMWSSTVPQAEITKALLIWAKACESIATRLRSGSPLVGK